MKSLRLINLAFIDFKYWLKKLFHFLIRFECSGQQILDTVLSFCSAAKGLIPLLN